MTRPWRSAEQQLAYEAQLPDRFDDGAAWLAAAQQTLNLPATSRSGFRLAPGLRGKHTLIPIPDRAAAARDALRDAYERARLDARWLSLAGVDAVQREINRLAIAIRQPLDPDATTRLRMGLLILQQALADPDRRAPWSRVLRDAY